jgi:5-methylcytosine-specific restriction protein A
MNSYLFTWNPSKWKWTDLPEAVFKVNSGEAYYDYWSCGNTKKIKVGDRFLLMKLGSNQEKGVIGAGQVLSEPYLRPHWDEEKARRGETTLRSDIVFTALSEKPAINEVTLKTMSPLDEFDWFPQSSGVTIPDHISEFAFSMFEESTGFKLDNLPLSQLIKLREGMPKKITINSYDRSPLARQLCIEHLGTSCDVCGFNFEAKYGEIGKGFTHVHHLRQLAEISAEYEIDPIKDLRPVCANCHAMLHKRRPAYSIEEIKTKINT